MVDTGYTYLKSGEDFPTYRVKDCGHIAGSDPKGALGAEENRFVALGRAGDVRDVHEKVIHHHAPDDGASPTGDEDMAMIAKGPAPPVGVTHGHETCPGGPGRPPGEAVSHALAWGYVYHPRKTCFEREDRPELWAWGVRRDNPVQS